MHSPDKVKNIYAGNYHEVELTGANVIHCVGVMLGTVALRSSGS